VTLLESLAALAVTPPAARLWAAGRRDEVVRLLSSLATINTVVVVLVVLAFAAFGDVALEIAYGPEMRGAMWLLVVLACGGIAQGAFGVNISLLIICGRINEVSRTALGVLAVFLPCAVAAAFLGGPMQLAIVSACGMAALSVCEWFTARRCLDRAPHPRLNPVLAVRELVSETRLAPSKDDLEEGGAAESAR
jgi:O-antigen/teichoic acid export membrane protein